MISRWWCKLGRHDERASKVQRYLDMGFFHLVPTIAEQCGRCGTHRIWLFGIGWSGVRYGPEDNLVNQRHGGVA